VVRIAVKIMKLPESWTTQSLSRQNTAAIDAWRCIAKRQNMNLLQDQHTPADKMTGCLGT
jgi:hypothetical protein